jgi:hypothetical protein
LHICFEAAERAHNRTSPRRQMAHIKTAVTSHGELLNQGRPIEARILVLNFAANADVTRASYPAGQT